MFTSPLAMTSMTLAMSATSIGCNILLYANDVQACGIDTGCHVLYHVECDVHYAPGTDGECALFEGWK